MAGECTNYFTVPLKQLAHGFRAAAKEIQYQHYYNLQFKANILLAIKNRFETTYYLSLPSPSKEQHGKSLSEWKVSLYVIKTTIRNHSTNYEFTITMY